MQITGLSAGYADSGAVGRGNQLLAAASGKGADQAAPTAAGRNAIMDVFRGIVSQYDLTDITPRDFSEMLRKLREAGVLSDAEYTDLARIRLDMDAENVDPDDSLDLLEFCRKSLDRAHRDEDSEPTTEIPAGIRRRLDWLEKVAILQDSPEPAGLNALV